VFGTSRRKAAQIRRGITLARINHPRFDWRSCGMREPWLVLYAWQHTAEHMDRPRHRAKA